MPERPVPADAGALQDVAPDLMTEQLTDDWGFYIRSARRLEQFRSPFQAVEVHDSVPFGKLFRLDGHFMTSEKDEFFYHENLVHPAAMAHPAPVRALVIGGGDGGSSEELLKHSTMQLVHMAELDPDVIEVSRRLFGAVHRDAFYQFQPQGVTGTVLLAESHLAIHTWPERGFVTVDVYVCNLANDNSEKAKRLFGALEAILKPARTKYQAIHRGSVDA